MQYKYTKIYYARIIKSQQFNVKFYAKKNHPNLGWLVIIFLKNYPNFPFTTATTAPIIAPITIPIATSIAKV